MISIREQVASAIVAAISGSGALGATGMPAGLNVHRERTRPIEKDDLPAVLIYFEDEEPEPLAKERFRAPLTERCLDVVAEIRCVPQSGQSPDEAIDAIYVWLMQSLGADETFGRLAMGIIEGPVKWFSKEVDVIYAGAAVHLSVHYRTSRLDPTTKTGL
jgi:hypothetical protein